MKSEIPWSEIILFITNFVEFYFSYLILKFLVFTSPISFIKSGSFFIRDGILLFILSMTLPFVSLKLFETYGIDQNLFSFLVLALALFIPWSLFFDRDAYGYREDKIPIIQATTQFPIHVASKGAKGWGILFIVFGLIFIIISFFSFNGKISNLWVSFVLFIPFFLMGSLFFIIGLNLQWAYTKFIITPDYVEGHTLYFIPWPRHFFWRNSTQEYQSPQKVIRRRTGSKNTGHSTYEIHMNFKQSERPKSFTLRPSKNIVLYRAYHGEDLDKMLTTYKNLFM
ncbi:MAG: hypothetical protein ACK5W9_11880 [Bdellovibrionales bacterium]